MRIALLLLLACPFVSPTDLCSLEGSLVDSRGPELPRWGYAFQGYVPHKLFKKEVSPVVGATRKGLLLDTSKGVKRVKYGQAGVSLESALQLTPRFARLGEFKVVFENRAQLRRDSALQTALSADIEYAQAKLDQMNAADPSTPIPGKPERMSNEEFSAELSEASDSSSALMESMVERAGQVADTMFLSFEIVPDQDMQNAYAVVALYYDRFDQEGNVSGRVPVFSIEKMGDLMGEVPNKVSMDLTTSEQFIQNLEFQLYLFLNDGTPVATNASGALQKINEVERAYIQEKLSKRMLR